MSTTVDQHVDGLDLYGDDNDSGYHEPEDAISEAVGSRGYLQDAVLPDCYERLAGGASREPETFDRLYWDPERLVIDILTGEESEREAEAEEKHVAFKRSWCEENGIRYVVLTDEDTFDPDRLEELFARADETPAVDPPPALDPSPAPRARRAAASRSKSTAKKKPAARTRKKPAARKPARKKPSAKGGSGRVQRPRKR